MRIEFLGTGGFFANERRQTACVMLPEIGLVFDAGTSVFRIAQKLVNPELDIFLSHAHLDHVVGLTSLLVPLMSGKIKAARVHASKQYLAAVQEHLFAEAIFPILPRFEFVELKDSVAVGGGVLSHIPLVHPGGSTGFRIDWPQKSLAYITDTCVDGSYTEFVRGVDVLIHECYYPDQMSEWSAKTGHSNTTPVAELARDADVGRLMLVHIDPHRPGDDPIGIDTARKIFPRTEVAEDLMTIEL
ncbi:MAG: MBL fold metallo-hydrolase [Planctomycetaceae bacterium]